MTTPQSYGRWRDEAERQRGPRDRAAPVRPLAGRCGSRQAPRGHEAAPVVAGQRFHGHGPPGARRVDEAVVADIDPHVGDAPPVGPEEDEIAFLQLTNRHFLAVMSL